MYVARVPNRNSPPAYLLREGYREDGKVKSRTLANLSHWPLAKIERLREVLRDEVLPDGRGGLTMLRSLPHGHVAAVLGTARQLDAMTATSSLGALLGLGTVSEQELYTALDWLLSANHTLNASSFAASAPGNSGAVRCDVKLFRGTHLSAGAARLQP